MSNFAVEYFIPYAFVSHDLIWNLIPVDPSFNSRKNDKLPRIEDYFDGFYNLQKTAITIMAENYPKEPIMDEYLSIFPNADAHQLPEMDVRGWFLENIQPLLTIAKNNGFEYMKSILFNYGRLGLLEQSSPCKASFEPTIITEARVASL